MCKTSVSVRVVHREEESASCLFLASDGLLASRLRWAWACRRTALISVFMFTWHSPGISVLCPNFPFLRGHSHMGVGPTSVTSS